MFRRIALFLALMTASVSVFSSESSAQSSDKSEEVKVIETVKTIFVAAKADDLEKFHSVTTAGFYLYDNGERFDGDAIMKQMKSAHSDGQVYDWNVTEPDVHVTGNIAWIAYINQGSVTVASKTRQLRWLESAFLEKLDGVWKIVFMHSTRVPDAKLP